MSAPTDKPIADVQMTRRLRDVLGQLEQAVDHAHDAVNTLDPGAEGRDAGYRALCALPELVLTTHDSEHEGPLRWCANPVCRHVHEAGLL